MELQMDSSGKGKAAVEELDAAVSAGKHVLAVKHVPEALDPTSLEKLFRHFGALNVCRRRHAVYVSFADEAHANRAQAQLHRVRILNKVLSIQKVTPLPPFEQSPGAAVGTTRGARICQPPAPASDQPPPPPDTPPPGVPTPAAHLDSAWPPAAQPPLPPVVPVPVQPRPPKHQPSGAGSFAPPLPAGLPPGPAAAMPAGNVQVAASADGQQGGGKVPPPPGEPIALNLGLDYPFPPNLEYNYPPPDGNILTNIVNALIAVPRFYTQVLHLMNKMNLPVPFCPARPTPPLPAPSQLPATPPSEPPPQGSGEALADSAPPPPPPGSPPPAEELSSSESELEESDEEDKKGASLRGEEEDQSGGASDRPRKRAKKGAQSAVHTWQAAGVKVEALPTGLPTVIKKKQPVIPIRLGAARPGGRAGGGTPRGTGQGGDAPGPAADTQDASGRRDGGQLAASLEEEASEGDPATRDEIWAGRIPSSEMSSLPAFKNYSPGATSPVLYIKNLAKTVTAKNLLRVYAAFFSSQREAQAQLQIRLMQEGRMKGQAFVSFPTAELAQEALDVSHGFVLEGKPMVVQFGRKPTTQPSKETG